MSLTNDSLVLGAMSKALATLITQPLIVAKVGLQSRPPPDRQGKAFKSFIEVMSYIIENEGLLALFKGIAPQITKGILVQGLLMMTKERYVPQLIYLLNTGLSFSRMEIIFIVLFAYLRKLRSAKVHKAAELAAARARQVLPVVNK